MSTKKDFIDAIIAFDVRFETLGPQALSPAQELLVCEAQLRVFLCKAIVQAQGMDPQNHWQYINHVPETTILSHDAEDMFQSYLKLLRMNFGIRVGAMDTFREVQQVYGGLQGYPLAESLPASVRTQAEMTFRALCVQVASDNHKDVVEIQSNFSFLPEGLVFSKTAKVLADRYFTFIETIFPPSG